MKESIVNGNDTRVYKFPDINLAVSIFVSNEEKIQGIHLFIPDDHNISKLKEKSERSEFSETLTKSKELMWNLIDSYFEGKNIDHTLFYDQILQDPSIFSKFTEFQGKIFKELCKTKIGELLTYKDLAVKIGTNAYRAVGNTMRNNPFPILIPCHRVINSKGLGGFMGMNSNLKLKKDSLVKKNVKIEMETDTPNPIRIKISLLNFEKNNNNN